MSIDEDDLLRNLSPRPTRGEAPIQMDDTPVPLRSDPLDQILWRGRQWAVTKYGLERLDGTYPIDAARLLQDPEQGGFPAHVSRKLWADVDDFLTAWLVALALHGVQASAETVRDMIAKAPPSTKD